MNKKIFSLTIAFVVVTGGFLLFGNKNANPEATLTGNQAVAIEQENTQTALGQTEASTVEKVEQPTQSTAPGAYVDYSDAKLAAAQDGKRILFFHAPWCGVCKFFEDEILEQGVPTGVTVLKIDYDSSTELKKKYGVQIQSTFVLLDGNGDIVKTWPYGIGLTSISDLFEAV